MQKVKGYTYIEVMVAVGVIGVLTAIAWPSYQRYVARADIDRCIKQALPVRMTVDNLILLNNGSAAAITAANLQAGNNDCTGGFTVNGGTAAGAINVVATTNVRSQGNVTFTLSRAAANGTWSCTTAGVDTGLAPTTC